MLRKLLTFNSFRLGIAITLLFALPAIPGYLITTDQSSDCNEIIPELANRAPGSSFTYIVLKNAQANTDSRMHIWLWGKGTTGDIVAGQPIGNVVADSLTFITSGEKYAKKYAVNELIADADGQVLHHRTNWLGTDRFGRDVLSRLIIGARVSLSVGFISVFISLFLGTIIGMAAGYFGGKTDSVLSWFIAVFWSVPTLLVALGLSFAFGKGYWQVLIACGLSTWVEVARVVRGQTLQLRQKEFVLAGIITGFGPWYMMRKHILPNLKGSLTVMATTNFAAAILLESGLSFLGLGISPPTPSWGSMAKEHLGNLVLDSAWLALIPGIAIMLLVMAFNLMAMGMRDALDNQNNT
jgi:peptide/nickel transport system permease protein